jgi:amino acid transporter
MIINIWIFIILCILAFIGFFITAIFILFSFVKFDEYQGGYDEDYCYYTPEPKKKRKKRK